MIVTSNGLKFFELTNNEWNVPLSQQITSEKKSYNYNRGLVFCLVVITYLYTTIGSLLLDIPQNYIYLFTNKLKCN